MYHPLQILMGNAMSGYFCTNCGRSLMPTMRICPECGNKRFSAMPPAITKSANPTPVMHVGQKASYINQNAASPTTPKFAGFWFRTLASIIDGVLCQLLIIFIVAPIGFSLGLQLADSYSLSEIEMIGYGTGFVLGGLIQWLWFTVAESSKWQATIGKKMVGLKVTGEIGERISFGKANGRYWSKILSTLILGVGFLMVAFTEKKQGLHDKIAGTLVIKTNP